mmetsp:Transcript_6020/g.14664  ORF Transcript_6020/g.14664 Transcript_6020/m.14664 type:complete len:231 (+) Transcript_6020:2-694(+)
MKCVAPAGLSLGEYTALVVGGAMKFEDALELVVLRGRAMQDAAEASVGTMVALLGADEEAAMKCVAFGTENGGGEVLVAANFNAPGQVVLSGGPAACAKAAEFAKEELKLKAIPLDVAGAFHSPLMAPAAERLKEALEATEVVAPRVPVMSNVTGLPHDGEPASIRQRLVEQLTNSVRWADCVVALREKEEAVGATWVELAPGKTLSGMMKKIDRKLPVVNYSEPPAETS